MNRTLIALVGAVSIAGTVAAIAANRPLNDEFGHCRPVAPRDNENVALRVVLGWGFEGIQHTNTKDAFGDKGPKRRAALDNSWKVTVYKDRRWLLSRGRSRETGAGEYVQEICTILGGERAVFYTEEELSGGDLSESRTRLTP
jgi:hypothetical protein